MQDNSKELWANVPLQDFTSSSDIDWSLNISDIDRQLYAKYGLTDTEITFVESMIV
jgi:type II restriction enzyme